MIALNSAVVSSTVVTPCASISDASASGVGSGADSTTQQPPPRSGHQMSNVDASNASGEAWRKTSCGPTLTTSPHASDTTFWWLTPTALGVPVDPDVYMTYARFDGPTSATTGSAVMRSWSASRSTTWHPSSPRVARSAAVVSTAVARVSSIIQASRSRGWLGSSGR